MPSAWLKKNQKKMTVTAEIEDEVSNRLLETTGTVPPWLTGTLVRNGPVNVMVDGKTNAHWFDGLAMLHAFSFREGKVAYTNKFLRSDDYRMVFDKGSLNYEGFASDPCRSLFSKFFTFLFPDTHALIQNGNVNVARLADAYVALTEVPLPVRFDPKTLETLGVLDYTDKLPKDKCWESAHPHHDVKRKTTINYLIRYGLWCHYIIHEMDDGSAERKVIAEVPVQNPSYMHSFSITENYIVLTEYPFLVNPFDIITKRHPFIKNFTWMPQKGTRFTVIGRTDGKVINHYHTKPFFSFHHANAFEKDGLVHLDIVTYKDANIITGPTFYLDEEKSSVNDTPTQLERFTLSLWDGKITSETLLPRPNEFPRINEAFDGLPYRYVYATALAEGNVDTKEMVNSRGLYKLDTVSKALLEWSEDGCLPGEPVFIRNPAGKEEDDGVVVTVVIDRKRNTSFLLILDGRSFKELGRARAPHVIPAGLHAKYFD